MFTAIGSQLPFRQNRLQRYEKKYIYANISRKNLHSSNIFTTFAADLIINRYEELFQTYLPYSNMRIMRERMVASYVRLGARRTPHHCPDSVRQLK